jgi:ubiquinone/menaquinone biosynthesis C-methylase UbiE
MSPPGKGFDRLARGYRALEFLAFGRDLERARFCLLDRLQGCRSILVLGEGDGRCLARLTGIASAARIHCVDSSAAMLEIAAGRLAGSGAGGRVRLERADALSVRLDPAGYDAVVTLFFLDCFTSGQVESLVGRIVPCLRPGALWLWADFSLPARGAARWRARAWVSLLYAFFRWQTGLPARELPPVGLILDRAGLRCTDSREFQWGLVRSALYTGGLR